MALNLNINSFTLGELEDLEDALIASKVVADSAAFEALFTTEFDAAGDPVPRPMSRRVVTAMLWIIARRDEPGLTLADVRNWPLEKLAELTADATPARPTTRTAPNGSTRGARSQSTTAGRSPKSAR